MTGGGGSYYFNIIISKRSNSVLACYMYVEFTDISPKYPAFFLPAILLVDRPSYGTALLLVDTALSIGMLCLVIDVAGTLLHLMVFK